MYCSGDWLRWNDCHARSVTFQISIANFNLLLSTLARVSLIDRRGDVLYDTFVQPTGALESYRSTTTGLDESFFGDGTPHPLYNISRLTSSLAQPFSEVQIAVAAWIKDKVVIGHQLWTDFQV